MTDKQYQDYHKTLLEASKGMALVTDTGKLLRLIVHIVKKHMKVKNVSVFQYDESNKSFFLKSRRGENKITEGHKIGDDHSLIAWLKEKKRALLLGECDSQAAKTEMKKLDCAVCIPSFNKERLIGFLMLGDKISGELYTEQETGLLLTLSNEVAIAIENTKNMAELQRLREKEKENNLQTVLALARTVDEKDSYTRGHLDEVTKYGMVVAEELISMLGIKMDMEELRTALLLHDIGKIGVPDALLHKNGNLTPEEFEIMKQHPEMGARIVEPIEKLKRVGMIIRYHQEKYDGSGYPEGLKGEEIPLEARIVAVVDTYHAMVSDRPYRKALPEDVALDELKNNSGTQFDPVVVRAFMKAYEKGNIKKSEEQS